MFNEKEYQKKYYKENKERLKKVSLNIYYLNREKRKEYRERYNKQYYINNKEEIKLQKKQYYKSNIKIITEKRRENKHKHNLYSIEYNNKKRKTDINVKLTMLLRSRLSSAIKSNQKVGSAVRDLGCTIPYFKRYLENQFKEGMSWDNWSINGWHIDHQIPLSIVDLTNKEDLNQVCHYTNLQPMWAKDNLVKSNNI